MPTECQKYGEAVRELRRRLRVLVRLTLDPRLCDRIDVQWVVSTTIDSLRKHLEPWITLGMIEYAPLLRYTLGSQLAAAIARLDDGRYADDRERDFELSCDDRPGWRRETCAATTYAPSLRIQIDDYGWALTEPLAAMPEDQRQAYMMAHRHGWSDAEIGARLGHTPLDVARLLDQAREVIQQAFTVAR